MTATRADLDRLDAWADQELERVQQENRIRKLLVVVGLATLAVGFAVAVYLTYNDQQGDLAHDAAPLTGDQRWPTG